MKKTKGLLILLISYIFAFSSGLIVTILLKNTFSILLDIFIGNVVATVIIWLSGVIFHSASVYDPYWSIQTLLIGLSLLIHYNNWNLGNILFMLMLAFWSLRLTYNFIHGFSDIRYVDWRYKLIKRKTGNLFQIVNLLGICLVPTLIVYLASIPLYLYILNNRQFEFTNIIGLSIMLLGILLELISDKDMAAFKKIRKSKSEIIQKRLWKYSRHPNYLGEILFWYGVLFVYFISPLFSFKDWYAVVGTILNTLLFLFISIPLAENNMKTYKPEYLEYKKKTRMLLPIKK